MSRRHSTNRNFVKRYEDRGWVVRTTRGNHLCLTHPGLPGCKLFSSSTPSDHRSFKNLDAMVRRAERLRGHQQ